MRFLRSTFIAVLVQVASAAVIPSTRGEQDQNVRINYDAIIIGGGPSGLAACSGLARVRRNVLLIDSGVYRNNPTRHMHDVLGYDGVTPAYYRWAARNQLNNYGTIAMTNGTVTKIQPERNNTYFTVKMNSQSKVTETFTARKIILGTGLRDILPSTPGIAENWGRGIYWCPWCDGHEHADQALGLMGTLDNVPGMVREVLTLDTDLVALVNGSDTPAMRATTDKKSPGWEKWLDMHNVQVENRTIKSVVRLMDGASVHGDPSLPTFPEHDLFQINFETGDPITRAAFLTSFKDEQESTLGQDLGVKLYGGRLFADPSAGLETNIPGVYAIGDANSDNVTNVPHALFSGKRTAVYLHVKLEKEDMATELAATDSKDNTQDKRDVDEVVKDLWKRINGEPGEILYAPDMI